MSGIDDPLRKAFRSFTSAQIGLSLEQSRYSVGDVLAAQQAQGTVEGTVEFLIRMLGRHDAAEFFYRVADGVAAPTPQTVEK